MGNNIRGKKLVYGVGINDVDAPISWWENGKRVRDPYYEIWEPILRRCYGPKFQKKFPTYIGCTMHSDWHRLSKFKEWADSQPQTDWRDLQIDKDLLVKGNKVYGPDTCCFLTHRENTVFRPSAIKLGSARHMNTGKRKKRWRSKIAFGMRRKTLCFGYYSTREEAEIAAFQASLPIVTELANANPHQFIREAMYRWIEDWKQTLVLMEEEFKNTQASPLPLFETT